MHTEHPFWVFELPTKCWVIYKRIRTHCGANCGLDERVILSQPLVLPQRYGIVLIVSATLSGKGCRAFRYKPLAARSSRRFLDKHSEPPESLLLPGEKEMPPHVLKYWSQRYRLFSRFDEGVQINRGNLLFGFGAVPLDM